MILLQVMRSIGITITVLDIIHRPVFYLKRYVSESLLCLRLHVEPTQSEDRD
jgi:hypothetical protein